MENNGITIPAGTRKEDIKAREKIIKDFYAKWISEHPDKKIWNEIFKTISVSNINPSTKHTTRLQEDTNLPLLYSV